MDKDDMLKSLGFFLALEIEQVNLYEVQADQAAEEHCAIALKRFMEIEQGHVDNLSAAIRDLGGEPGLLAKISPTLGKIAGRITEVTGLVNLLRADIVTETFATRSYQHLLDRTNDPHLRDLLWKNMIDEELHRAWMIDKVNELTGSRQESFEPWHGPNKGKGKEKAPADKLEAGWLSPRTNSLPGDKVLPFG